MEQNSNMNKRFITWNYIETAVDNIASQIKSSGLDIQYIFGMPRGGLIPAVMLSHKLNIPLFKFGMVLDSKVLIVDDICDSGHTLKNYEPYRCPTATIHYKTTAEYEPSFWWRLAPQNEWIVYPWENKDSKTVADYLAR